MVWQLQQHEAAGSTATGSWQHGIMAAGLAHQARQHPRSFKLVLPYMLSLCIHFRFDFLPRPPLLHFKNVDVCCSMLIPLLLPSLS